MNWALIVIVGVIALALLVFINVRNKKDKKELTDKLNNDYRKSKDDEGDTPTENTTQ